ncbi:MAG: ATP-binding protein [Planctomycetota bacterium]
MTPHPRPRPRLARLAAGLVVAAGLVAAVAGCAADTEDVNARRATRVDRALADVTARLTDALTRARRALERTRATMDEAGTDVAARFSALERLRAAHDLRGLEFSDAGSASVWAGVPVEPRDLPDPPAPWGGSFLSGDVTWHAGPFVRAIVVARTADAGSASASVVLDDGGVSSPFGPPLETRWAERLGVAAVRVLPRESLDRPPTAGVRRGAVLDPTTRAPVFAVEVEAPADEVLAAEIEADHRRGEGWFGLAGLAVFALAAAAAIRRWTPQGVARGLAWTALPLVVRQGLRWIDLKARFPGLASSLDAAGFGRQGYLGWISSPGDALLTCVALLLASLGVARALRELPPGSRPAGRLATALLGVLVATGGTALWLFFVESVMTHSPPNLFEAGALFPSMDRVLRLAALVAVTAAAWVCCRAGLRRTVAACPHGRFTRVTAIVCAGVAACLGAWLRPAPTLPDYAPFLVVGAAALVGRLRPDAMRPGAPSRVLLVSILATAALFPVLWRSSETVERTDLVARIRELTERPDATASSLRATLPSLLEDAELLRAFRRYGGRASESDGLAIHAWKRLNFGSDRGQGALVAVYDAQDRRFDRFGLDVPPLHRIPDTRPDPERGDDPVTVTYVPATRDQVGATVAWVRMRGSDDRLVGTVAVAVPDALTVELLGLVPRIAARRPGSVEASRRGAPAEMCLVHDGAVELSTDPPSPSTLPRLDALAGLDEPTWFPAVDGAGAPWLAVPAGSRGVVLVRGRERTFEDVVYGLARAVLVGVGAGAAVALAVFVVGLRRFRPRLQDKILGSYFAVSLVPLVFLGYANWRDAVARAEQDFRERQTEIARSSRRELERTVSLNFAEQVERNIAQYADLRMQDLSVYRAGALVGSSLRGLVEAELLPHRLDGDVHRALAVEGRELLVREEDVAGRRARVAYTRLGTTEPPTAVLAVPLVYDSDRAELRAAETGSVLLAAYLLAFVLVVVAGLYTARGLARRLAALSDATRRVAGGDLDTALPRGGRDEVGALVDAFNMMTADLKRLREREAQSERESAWRGMARQVAHEIKNPLTPMKLMLQQLAATSRSDPPFATQMIEPTTKVVLEQIDALARIASDFSAFARFPPRAIEALDVNELLRSVAVLYAGGESARERIETDLAGDLPTVRWDRDELSRVFVNLVGNAVEAVDEAKGRVRVDVRSRRGPSPKDGRDGVVVTVADDGVGIPPENMRRLFQPDFSTKTRGTGLGLAIVKRIVTDLGGEIRIESAPGRGTTVTTWLPAATEGAEGPGPGRAAAGGDAAPVT